MPIKEHNDSSTLKAALLALERVKLLTPENIDAVKKDLYAFADALSALEEANLLTPKNVNTLIEHNYLFTFVRALSALQGANLLTQENIDAIAKHNNPYDLAKALSALKGANLLTPENVNAVKKHNDPCNLVEALSALKGANLLTPENVNVVQEHNDPCNLVEAFFLLKEAGLLKQYFNAAKEHYDSVTLKRALSALKKAGLLTQYFNTFKKHNNPSGLLTALCKLEDAHLLIQSFMPPLDPDNNILFTLKIKGNLIWNDIPQHLMQVAFQKLTGFTSQPNPEDCIRQYINFLLDNNNAGINNDQSTDTASIHQSVSTSACNLMKRYKDKLSESKLEEIITTIKEDILKLPDTLKNKAAKNCIERISKANFFIIINDSKVTIKQLLALSYLARHDDDNRQGSMEDANALFIDGLYEIQRGYNISANGFDDQEEEDRPICAAGTFNKLMEKLSGVHPDVQLIFITKELAAQKLPVIVREEMKNYLEKLSKPETKVGFHSFITLFEQLLKDSIEIIWNKIKPQVTDRVFDEYNSIYGNNKKNSSLLDLVDAGQYTQMENLGNYQQQIVSSAGYRKYCSQALQDSAKFAPLFFPLPRQDKKSTQCEVKESAIGAKHSSVTLDIVSGLQGMKK